MGGEGAMMTMITSLKNNNRRKKRAQFDIEKIGSYGDGEKVEFDFPEVTPEVLKNIRDRLQKERRQLMIFRYVLVAIATIILIIITLILK
ncbi:MAG TPA: hypothetical protein VKZ98_07875 [Aquaticitalea sp.]|nr:hypothetical protein [Aquaticitalea sp.]